MAESSALEISMTVQGTPNGLSSLQINQQQAFFLGSAEWVLIISMLQTVHRLKHTASGMMKQFDWAE